MEGIAGTARCELVRVVGERYRSCAPAEKRWVLDEFVARDGVAPKARHPDLERGRVRKRTNSEGAPTRVRRGCATSVARPLGGVGHNGSEFINEAVAAFCKKHNVELTRSRPYGKNDQAWVEQKNGAIVRRLVGYGRLEGLAATQTLNRLYIASRLFVNLFQPSFKLAEKTRIGARVIKKYHPPATPGARLLASESISEATKERVKAAQAALDPLRLLDEIRASQHELAALAAGARIRVPPTKNAELERFLSGLGTAWRDEEVRPTQATKQKPPRHWRNPQGLLSAYGQGSAPDDQAAMGITPWPAQVTPRWPSASASASPSAGVGGNRWRRTRCASGAAFSRSEGSPVRRRALSHKKEAGR